MDIAKLRFILAALEHSEPKQKHYPEPVERHNPAIACVIELLDGCCTRKSTIYVPHLR